MVYLHVRNNQGRKMRDSSTSITRAHHF